MAGNPLIALYALQTVRQGSSFDFSFKIMSAVKRNQIEIHLREIIAKAERSFNEHILIGIIFNLHAFGHNSQRFKDSIYKGYL